MLPILNRGRIFSVQYVQHDVPRLELRHQFSANTVKYQHCWEMKMKKPPVPKNSQQYSHHYCPVYMSCRLVEILALADAVTVLRILLAGVFFPIL